MRGAIAFGLVLKISDDFPGRDVIITTCLAVIVITTLVFATTTCSVGKLLLYKSEANPKPQETSSVNTEPLKVPLLPNETGLKKLGFTDYVKRLDEYILRPLLIFKYEKG